MNAHRNARIGHLRPHRGLAFLAVCASLLIAAAGVLAVATTRTVRDPENPAFAGNTIDSSTSTSVRVIRDPENPAYSGSTVVASTTSSGAKIVRDPENPLWHGATIGETVSGGSSTLGLR
jgi:hypothetical protein